MLRIAHLSASGHFFTRPGYDLFCGRARAELSVLFGAWRRLREEEGWNNEWFLHVDLASGIIVMSRKEAPRTHHEDLREIGRLSTPTVKVFSNDVMLAINHGARPVGKGAQIASLLALASEAAELRAKILAALTEALSP
jgi:hypothetical protein